MYLQRTKPLRPNEMQSPAFLFFKPPMSSEFKIINTGNKQAGHHSEQKGISSFRFLEMENNYTSFVKKKKRTLVIHDLTNMC